MRTNSGSYDKIAKEKKDNENIQIDIKDHNESEQGSAIVTKRRKCEAHALEKMKKTRIAGALFSVMVFLVSALLFSVSAKAQDVTISSYNVIDNYGCNSGFSATSAKIVGYMTANKTPLAGTDDPMGFLYVYEHDSNNNVIGFGSSSGRALGGYLTLGAHDNSITGTPYYSSIYCGIENAGVSYGGYH